MPGSTWKKSDLHFHSQTSYDYEDKSVTDEDIINDLISQGIEIVAVTDHHSINSDKIKRLQKLGESKLTDLPGIEFLSDAKRR